MRTVLCALLLLLSPARLHAAPPQGGPEDLDARVKRARVAAKAAADPAKTLFPALVGQVGGKKAALCDFEGPAHAQIDLFRGHMDEDRDKEIVVLVSVWEATGHPPEQRQCHWMGVYDCPKGRCVLAHQESTVGTACLSHHERRFTFGFSTKDLEDSSGLWIKRQLVDSCGATVAVTTVQEALWLEAATPKTARLAEYRYCHGDACPPTD